MEESLVPRTACERQRKVVMTQQETRARILRRDELELSTSLHVLHREASKLSAHR